MSSTRIRSYISQNKSKYIMNTTDISDLKIRTQEQLSKFSSYADQHDLYSTLQGLLKKLVVVKPQDSLLWLANEIEKNPTPNIVVLGPPNLESEELCISLASATRSVYLCASTMIKSAAERKSNLGLQALSALTKTQKVPDHIMIDIVISRIEEPDAVERGWVLHGFPCTQEQAVSLHRHGIIPSHTFVFEKSDCGPKTHSDLVPEPDTLDELSGKCIKEPALTQMDDQIFAYNRHLVGVLRVLKTHDIIPVPINMSCSHPRVKNAVSDALQVRRGWVKSAEYVHKIILVGGTDEMREEVSRLIELREPRLVKVSLDRIIKENRSRAGRDLERVQEIADKAINVSSEEHAAMIQARTEQHDCIQRGWVITHASWTSGLIEQIVRKLTPTRVLVLPNPNGEIEDEVINTIHTYYMRPKHPYFDHEKDTEEITKKLGCLQCVFGSSDTAESAEEVAERVIQLLSHPIEWYVPRDWTL